MSKKVMSIDEIRKQKFEEEFPESFDTTDVLKFTNMIEYNLNSFYDLGLEDEKYQSICSHEQFKLLTNIYSSFFKILYDEFDKFDETSDESCRIMYSFMCELYKICSNLTDAEVVRENIDKNVLKFENKEDKEGK